MSNNPFGLAFTYKLGNFMNEVSYENDTELSKFKLPGIPKGDPASDAYRTAAAEIKVGFVRTGIILHTGEADGRQGKDTNGDGKYDKWIKVGGSIGNASESQGIFYVGIGSLKMGWDSEGIRHGFQNKFAHDFMNGGNRGSAYPWIPKTKRKGRPFFQFGGGSGTTLY